MAHDNSLREFQSYLANRVDQAVAGETCASWLALESGGESWLVDLRDGGEIIPAPELCPVPLTQPWFAGLCNVRGTLYAVSDFAAFRGRPLTPRTSHTRLLLLGARHGANIGLLVERSFGLRKPEDLQPRADSGLPAYVRAQWQDAAAQTWQVLDVAALLAAPAFMQIAL